ncbi:hypothetical protein H6G54_05015 [Anabaena cylindrica FACHB-243]|uniref:Uncharacterized protein n=1 Tax=Anabaena cylindrica (strain ATCC 27899 / PCC 7122) TaxID=272123 RepID=K9ZNH8_ANACC|nr:MULTISPECIES: AidA/PixA family protein [Anabaena]AFZ60783.1 hypothetical protein Anacy_5468 [Anabaena cylindrica PCC 7122]MBD2417082.1 hypothetical protein [Anabaena cylindrica FACHB-243]MBY5280778.1 hypothetical protein [Anabaena sp. CCAP 1446/1C]MBY5307054.1 hypothetical protein [Anabaena sp. CCAP 1446/1C]MCM2406782.1 inclusion body family protein [Anabaena sp. CCAP 1446/1C]
MTPTTIACDHEYMIVTSAAAVKNQDSGNITLVACVNDTVRFFATSGSKLFEQSVVIQDIRYSQGDNVLQDFKTVKTKRMQIVPASSKSVLPARSVLREFWQHECKVSCEGTGCYSLILALYVRDENGEPNFTGLYQWDAQITVYFSPSLEAITKNYEDVSWAKPSTFLLRSTRMLSRSSIPTLVKIRIDPLELATTTVTRSQQGQ